MKKQIVLLLPIVLGFFVVVAVSADDVVQRELDALMEKWITSLSAEDIDAMMICYWPDVSDVTYDPNGQSYLLEGSSAIRQSQQEWFDNVDYESLNFEYPEPERFLPKTGDTPVYVYNYREHKFIDVFYFQKRTGKYRIIHHILLINPQSD